GQSCADRGLLRLRKLRLQDRPRRPSRLAGMDDEDRFLGPETEADGVDRRHFRHSGAEGVHEHHREVRPEHADVAGRHPSRVRRVGAPARMDGRDRRQGRRQGRKSLMIVELVTFPSPPGKPREKLLEEAKATLPRWRANKELIRKHYMNDGNGLGGGVYIWPSREAAERAHDAEWQA